MRYTIWILTAFLSTVLVGSARAETEVEPYRFSGGEKISIKIQPVAAGEVADQVIGDNGNLSLPTGTPVNVKGKTLDEAKDIIAKKMIDETSYKAVQVRLIVLDYPPRRVYVAGEVRAPKSITLSPGVPLFLVSALQEGGGITDQGDATQVNLVHTDSDGKRTSVVVDVTKFAQPGNPDLGPKLVAGDTILVPRCAHFLFIGEFNRVGMISVGDLHLEPGEKPALSRVIAGIGGVKKEGDLKKLKIFRMKADGTREVTSPFEKGIGAQDPLLVNGDIIEVPTKPAQALKEGAPVFSVSITGKVRAPGIYQIGDNGLKLSKLIMMAGGFNEFAKSRKVTLNRPGQGGLQIIDAKAILKEGAWDQDIELKDGDVIDVPERAF